MAKKKTTIETINAEMKQVVNTESPTMKQYRLLKEKQPEAMLLFRTGDFYELFRQDAKDAAAILDLTLTFRDFGEHVDYTMFPASKLDTYLPKIVRAGKRVAICDQLDDPTTKKLVKRGSSETTTDNNSSTPNNNETMATKNTTNESKSTVKNNADKAIVQPLGDHGTLVIGGVPRREKKQEQSAEPISEAPTAQNTPSAPNNQTTPTEATVSEELPTVTLSTYTTKKGATAPQIIGFAGEDDPRWVRNKGKKCVSASYRRDLSGNKVYVLLFGTKYMDAARAMADAYNTNDQAAWEAAEAQAQATLEQAQADGKAAWEAKKQEWAEKKAAREAKKAATETATTAKTYTEAEVAALMQRVLKNDAQAIAEVNAMLEKAA